MRTRTVKNGQGLILERQSRTFDELGRVLALIGASAQRWTHSYDKVGNLLSVQDPRQNLYQYAYDGLNRLIKLTDEDGYVTDLARTAGGEVASHTDDNLVATTYVRNGWGEPIREQSPDIGTVDYVRNRLGLVVSKTDGRGVVSTFEYDSAGRLIGTGYPAAPGEDVTYSYDAIDNGNKGVGRLTRVDDHSGVTSFAYGSLDRVVVAVHRIGAKAYRVRSDYDPAGRLLKITYHSGRIVSYSYDAAGEPTGISTQKTVSDPVIPLVTGVSTRPFGGAIAELTHANLTRDSRTFDNDGRVTGYSSVRGAATRTSKSLEYGDGVNLGAIRDVLAPNLDETYWYTPANRLQNTTGPWGELDFFTDGVGNRAWRERSQAGGATTSDAYPLVPGTNRIEGIVRDGSLARQFTYDGAGNILTDTKGGVTTTYSYNQAGRLASVDVGGSGRGPYIYNAFGQLVSRTVTAGVAASTVHMIYDRDGNLIAEADAATGVTMREYVWLQGRPVAVFDDVDTGNPVVFHVHVDHLDRPVMMTEAAGPLVWRASYLPFGEVRQITGSASLDHRFPGQWFMLEVGLAYNWHRWYDATLGRYTQPDPLGLEAGPNRYVYALNSPLMYTDPDGQQSRSIPGRTPIPGFLPPITIPGTPENNAWTKWAMDKIMACFAADDDDERCQNVLRACRRRCTDTYVKSPNNLPGSGSDMPGRLRRCIRECMEDNGGLNF